MDRVVLMALAVATSAAISEAGPRVASFPCADGVLLRVSDSAPKQGSVVIVELRGEVPLASAEAFSAGDALHFWHDADARVYQALLGIDFLSKPGSRSVRARAVLESGATVECEAELGVVDGAFRVQHLNVAPRYVELSPENLARAQRETAELNDIFDSFTSERFWRRFVEPVPGYSPSGSFGKRRVFNGEPRRPHSGEDFPAPAGTPVRASGRARVVLAKGLFFLGNTVVLDHGFGLISFYGHLSAIAVEPGQMIEAETILGKVGATGRVTGAHLHWGVRLGDARVNPMDLIALGR